MYMYSAKLMLGTGTATRGICAFGTIYWRLGIKIRYFVVQLRHDLPLTRK